MEVRDLLSVVQMKLPQVIETSLFCPETRPLAIQNLYARANAPGDVRLSCQYSNYTPMFGPSSASYHPSSRNRPFCSTAATTTTHSEFSLVTTSVTERTNHCVCNCGRCHQNSAQATTHPKQDFCLNGKPNGDDEMGKNSEQHGHCPTQTDSEYGTTRSCDCCRRASSNSSSSSVVTWSSITSSTFDPPQSLLHMVKAEQQKAINCHKQSKLKEPLSSFSSGEYFTEPKTIDDFFRKNNVSESHKTSPPTTVCTCSCTKSVCKDSASDNRLTSEEFDSSTVNSCVEMSSANDNQPNGRESNGDAISIFNVPSNHALSTDTIGHSEDYNRCWWWGNEHNRQRWSLGSSPLKPVNLDETTIWLRENIETRRVIDITLHMTHINPFIKKTKFIFSYSRRVL